MSAFNWDIYFKEREEAVNSEVENTVVDTHVSEAASDEPSKDADDLAGEPLDAGFRDAAEYRKLLDFLKGKNNVTVPVSPPKEAAKGWFVVDEQTKGFWADGNWSTDASQLQASMIDSEKAAHQLAKVVNGLVVPAEDLLN